jgi:GNAT superfamily N-acetyltransferase
MQLQDGYTDVPAGKIAAVVTSLEMRAPPRRPAPSSGVDLERVLHPSLSWYRDLFRRVGADWLWFSRLRLGDEALSAIIHHPDVEIFAYERDGRAEGLLELDFREPDSCELAFLGLTRAVQGGGIGRALLRTAVDRAWSRPIARFWVHTCTLDHPAALPLYVAAGFVPFKRQVEVADDPRLSGEAPRSAAPHVPLLTR